MLKLLIETVFVVGVVAFGLYRAFRSGVARLGPLEADRSANLYGFIIMMGIYAVALLLAAAVFLRYAMILFPS